MQRLLIKFLLATCFFLAATVHATAETRLTVATLRSLSQAPVWVALESGFYKEQGLDIVPVQFSSGPQSIMAIISDDVQITTTGGPPAINARLKGGDIVLVGTTVGVYPYVLYVSGRIQKPADLKDKKVGISSFGGASHAATQVALQRLGLNPKTDVTMVQIGSQASRLSAMASGSIEATLIQPPESLLAREMNFKPMVNLVQSGIKFPLNHLTTTRRYLRNNSETARKFMLATIGGIARFKSDQNFTLKVLEKFLGLSDPKILTETYKFWAPIYPARAYVDPAEIEAYLSTVADRASSRVEDFFDNSIIAGLDREGLIDAIYRKYKK